MNLTALALKSLAFKAHVFENSTKDPIAFQKRILFAYLKRNRNTEYGRKYDFSAIRSIEEYRNRVPVSDCDSIRPYIERMTKGESDILVSDEVVFFGLTSGTTARQKHIPVTDYSRKKKAQVADLWAYYIARDHPKILSGKILAIMNSDTEGFTPSGIPCGAESGHGYKNLPLAVKNLYALPYQIFDIPDYESRYYTILRIGMAHNITTIATLNPSTIILLCRKVRAWQDEIVADIEKGTLSANFDIPADIRKAVEKTIRPDPRRAGELKKIIRENGKLLPKYFWPDMQLIECWKGGTVKLHLNELPEYFGEVPVRDFGCLSTEARSSIPMSDEGAGGVLAVNANFYEFIPREDIDKPDKTFLLCDQLEEGKEYFLIVTTPGGLYRYNIDDIVRVDGFFNKTPVIEFVQKGLNAVSVTGEKLYESQVNEAVIRASAKHKMLITFFAACAEIGDPSRYAFLVEFKTSPSQSDKASLLRSIEEGLYGQNNEYEYVRKAQLLGPPVLKVVKNGGFERYRAGKIKGGMRDSQFKAPELTQDPAFQANFEIEEVIDYP